MGTCKRQPPTTLPTTLAFLRLMRFAYKCFGLSGEPGRTRTSNPLIKSQLLYH